jgi:hypothetical protein
MKKLSIFLVATIAVVSLFFVNSAFTSGDKTTKPPVYEHFEYIGSSYNEADFENDANWISLGTSNPASNPCTPGSTRICVVAVDETQLSTNPSLTLPEKMELFLIGEPSADTYVNGNATYKKP